jgi:hypothetical protein
MNALLAQHFRMGDQTWKCGARKTSARPGGWLPCAARDHGEEGIAERIGETVSQVMERLGEQPPG